MTIGIIGINTAAALAMEIALDAGNKVVLVDDNPAKTGTDFRSHTIAGSTSDLLEQKINIDTFVICFGEKLMFVKKDKYQQLTAAGLKPTNIIHPSFVSFRSTIMGSGNIIGAGVVMGHETNFGNDCVVFGGVVIEHNTIVHDHCYFGPNVTVSGCCEIGEASLIGSGATLLPEVKIGKGCVIGAGAVVTKNTEDFSIVKGVPAQLIKYNKP
jgi:sugar O-acyltransferase (sialic acid O-acetyltransferase NeuD family)